jgi:cupin 2 domain-containing protein
MLHDNCDCIDPFNKTEIDALMVPTNVYSEIPNDLPVELFTSLLRAPGVRIERIVSHGHTSSEDTWYDQGQHEWVILLKGAARLRFEDDEMTLDLKSGDFVNIPAHKKHRVEWTTPETPTIWLAVHYGDRS